MGRGEKDERVVVKSLVALETLVVGMARRWDTRPTCTVVKRAWHTSLPRAPLRLPRGTPLLAGSGALPLFPMSCQVLRFVPVQTPESAAQRRSRINDTPSLLRAHRYPCAPSALARRRCGCKLGASAVRRPGGTSIRGRACPPTYASPEPAETNSIHLALETALSMSMTLPVSTPMHTHRLSLYQKIAHHSSCIALAS